MKRITILKKGNRKDLKRKCDICGKLNNNHNGFDDGTYFPDIDLNVCFNCKKMLLESFCSDIWKNPNEYITKEWLRKELFKIAIRYWIPKNFDIRVLKPKKKSWLKRFKR